MTETDLQKLAELLDGFGLAFHLQATDGLPAISNRQHGQQPARPGHTRTMTLADGRRLVLSDNIADAEPAAAQAGDPPAAGGAGAVPPGVQRALQDNRYALLAEHAIDLMVAVDDDLLMRYASPAAQTMLGRAPESLLGHTLAELLAPEDRAAFIARHFTRAARRGAVPDLFRALRADGSTLWVEARVAALPAGNGLGQFLVTLRDADRRRKAEEALAEINTELAALAATDALTGLPNRRQFDQTLNKEWYRALRESASLGLLMIDVDRFKALNDLFGHPIGDAVLSQVGRVIRDTVRRAGDLATRYGGEEFAVVLPGTGRTGAMELAEAIRRAVAACDTRAIIEGGYPISVSVGVATAVPGQGHSAPELLHAADAALYQAKRNGRNRVECLG